MRESRDITFYVPTRNSEHTLGPCLQSVQAQTLRPSELIVVVDMRSTDRTIDVARRHGARIIEQHDGTLGAARNQAIMAASTRWIASCDADVTIAPDWLETLSARRDDNVAGIAGRTDEHSQEPPDRWRALHMPHHWGEAPLRNPFMLVSEVLFDRHALLSVGGYRNDLNNYEDSDLCQRLRDAGYDLFYEPAAKARHYRRDSLTGVLDLRWRYAEYRQRHAFDGFAGLLRKIDVNREYAIQTLSKTLASGHEELGYLSFLLFFHHVVADQKALLARRTLIPVEQHAWYAYRIATAAIATLWEANPELAKWVRHDLSLAGAYSLPVKPPAYLPPAYTEHLTRVREATIRFLEEIPLVVRPILSASAAFCHGPETAPRVPRLQPPTPEQVQEWLDPLPMETAVAEQSCQMWQQHWPDARRASLVGRISPAEQATIEKLFSVVDRSGCETGTSDLVICPHLERFARPLDQLGELRHMASRAVVAYQPPRRFIPGLDVPAARDLASAAVKAGWNIVRFDTLVGQTALMLEHAV